MAHDLYYQDVELPVLVPERVPDEPVQTVLKRQAVGRMTEAWLAAGMRTFELLTVTSSFAYALWLAFGKTTHLWTFRILLLTVVLAAGAHFGLEGYRPQMAPIYLAVSGLLVTYPWVTAESVRSSLVTLVLSSALLVVLLAGGVYASAVLAPVFEFAPLSGSFAVGTISVHLTDPERADPFSPVQGTRREVMATIWYPAGNTQGARFARYADGSEGVRLSLVQTRSFAGPSVSQTGAPHPIVFFEHMFGGGRFQSTFQVEDLASHGFVVVAVDHPYLSGLTVFPDGRRIPFRDSPYLDFSTEEHLKQAWAAREFDVEVRLADVQFVLGKLLEWNLKDPEGRFTGRLNGSKIGIMGHSFGGSVAAEACRRDPRFLAGINMDGDLVGQTGRVGVPRPFFVMLGDTPNPTPSEIQSASGARKRELLYVRTSYDDLYRSLRVHGGYSFVAEGLAHFNYTDAPLVSLLASRTGAGSIHRRLAHELVNRYTTAFFERHLKDKPEPLLDDAADHLPGVRFETYKPIPAEVLGEAHAPQDFVPRDMPDIKPR